MKQALKVSWRDVVHDVPTCRTAEQVAETLERWPDGVIELERVFVHQSPSSKRARLHLANQVLELAGEPRLQALEGATLEDLHLLLHRRRTAEPLEGQRPPGPFAAQLMRSAAELDAGAGVEPVELTAEQVHELSMLRGFQPTSITDPDTGAAPVDTADELRLRKQWRKTK